MRWWRRKPKANHPDEPTVRSIIATNVALAARLGPDDHDRLVDLTSELIEDKAWEPIGSITLTGEVLVTTAANAAIPVLALGVGAYRNVASILMHATTRTSTGLQSGPAHGVVSEGPITTIGQAFPGSGPLSLTWPAALADSRFPARGRNVVIHEFAHKLDMLDGYTDGTPPLARKALADWGDLLDAEYGQQSAEVRDDPLRPYAFTNPAEFFAVSTETFFCLPRELRVARPALYAALADFFVLDPVESWDLEV